MSYGECTSTPFTFTRTCHMVNVHQLLSHIQLILELKAHNAVQYTTAHHSQHSTVDISTILNSAVHITYLITHPWPSIYFKIKVCLNNNPFISHVSTLIENYLFVFISSMERCYYITLCITCESSYYYFS